MSGAEGIGYEQVDRLAEEFVGVVTKQQRRLRVRQCDAAVVVDGGGLAGSV